MEKLIGIVRGLYEAALAARSPHEILVKYPEGSAAAGTLAGRYLLKRDAAGTLEYGFAPAKRSITPEPAFAELVQEHEFRDLESLHEYLSRRGAEHSVFVHGEPFRPYEVESLDVDTPEAGVVTMPVRRHPTWARWARVAGIGEHVDLTHEQLADLLIDNAEDLHDPMLARVVAQFRGARKVEYDANLEQSNAQLPREFAASVPAFIGAWDPGSEPRHTAIYRLRVLAPKGESATPMFRILWVNALDYEIAAAAALRERVLEMLTGHAVYIGKASSKHYISPRAA